MSNMKYIESNFHIICETNLKTDTAQDYSFSLYSSFSSKSFDSETDHRNMVTMETDAALKHHGSAQSILGSVMAAGGGRE